MKVRCGSRGFPRAARCCTEDSTHSTAARASGLDRPCRSTACSPSFRPRHSATCATTHDEYTSEPVFNVTQELFCACARAAPFGTAIFGMYFCK